MTYDIQIKDHFTGHNTDNKYRLFGIDGTKRFHWDIITMCNYHCEYCYSRANERMWNKLTTVVQIDEVISKLKRAEHPLEVIVLGGEPSLHPKYFYVMDEVYNIGDQLLVMGNITNGSFKNYKVFVDKHLRYKDKFHWNVTFHPSQVEDLSHFKDVILYIKDSGFKINVNVMLSDTEHKESTESMLDFCVEHELRFYFNVVFDHLGETYRNYDKGYAGWMRTLTDKYGEIKELVYFNEGEEVGRYNDIDVYLNGCSDFKGWKCKNNNFQIDVGGSVISKFCDWQVMTIEEINNEDDYMICPLSQCLCQGKLTNEKLK